MVIDSVSHEWEGEGGCDDIANAPILAGKKMADWKKAKSEHKKFMNALLQSNMHIIACIRAREKTSFVNPKQPVSLGLQPVCEKNFIFEMTTSFMVENSGATQVFTKIPAGLVGAFGDGNSYLNESCGKRIIDWVNSGEKVDEELELWKSKIQMSTESGVESMKKEWSSMPDNVKQKMQRFKRSFYESAKAYDDDKVKEPSANSYAQKQGFNPLSSSEPVTTKEPEPKPEPKEVDEPF